MRATPREVELNLVSMHSQTISAIRIGRVLHFLHHNKPVRLKQPHSFTSRSESRDESVNLVGTT